MTCWLAHFGLTVVGHMVLRNEADIVEETLTEAFSHLDTIIVLDGRSTDGTLEILERIRRRCQNEGDPIFGGKELIVVSEADYEGPMHSNHLRARLLELTYTLRPDWIVSIDADEIYDAHALDGHTVTLETAILAAEQLGANVVRCHVPQFWYTLHDLRHRDFMEQPATIQRARRWYSWGHMGTFIWKADPDRHYYPHDVPKRTPEIQGYTWREWQRAGPECPVCKHYTHRTPEQIARRARERLERGGREQFGKYALPRQIIDEAVAGLHYLEEGEGVPAWNTERNHERLQDYMGGLIS